MGNLLYNISTPFQQVKCYKCKDYYKPYYGAYSKRKSCRKHKINPITNNCYDCGNGYYFSNVCFHNKYHPDKCYNCC